MFIEPRNVILKDLLTIIDPDCEVYIIVEYDNGEIWEKDKCKWKDLILSDDDVESIVPLDLHLFEIVVHRDSFD